MAAERRQQGTGDDRPGKTAGQGEGTGAHGGKPPGDKAEGRTRRFEEGGPPQDWDPDTTRDGVMGGGGAGGTGGVTGGASGRTNKGR